MVVAFPSTLTDLVIPSMPVGFNTATDIFRLDEAGLAAAQINTPATGNEQLPTPVRPVSQCHRPVHDRCAWSWALYIGPHLNTEAAEVRIRCTCRWWFS